ncbi:MAG: hypothetical protein JW814_06160 [Candidatus Krumholzibacteriota bacterium]|nr:hypothetical protein [Candidatus Krumholzibacteriota bacterium]
MAARIIGNLPAAAVEVIDDIPSLIIQKPGKDDSLILTRHEGEFVKDFPSTPGAPPCGEKYIITTLNCPFACTYCYLQSYLAHGRIVVFTNIDRMKREIRKALSPRAVQRFTTGEMSDSLAIDHITGHTLELLPLFRGTGTLLEVRTKSANVGHIIDRMASDPGIAENLLITWTIAPSGAIRGEEYLASSVEERIGAMSRASAAGIRVAIRFDPVIPWYYDKDEYEKLARIIFGSVDHAMIHRFEIGVMRFPPGLWEKVRKRDSRSNLFKGEYFRDGEGKMRLYRPERIRIYREIDDIIRKYFSPARVDLSMEDREVWEDAGISAPRPGSEAELADR